MDILRSGDIILSVLPQAASNHIKQLMGDDSVTLVWEQSVYTSLQVGDYISYAGIKYTLNRLPTVKKLSTRLYQYNAVFQAPIYDLLKVSYLLFDNTETIPSGEFSLTGEPQAFIDLLVANLNRVFGASTWQPGVVISAEARTLTFSNESCYTVLSRLADEFETEYAVTGITINLIEITNAIDLTLEYGSTLYDIERKSVDSSNVITRLYPFGAQRNLSASYRSGSKRLLLPDPLQYIEANTELYGIIEGQQTFENIYPRLGATDAGAVTAIGADIFTFTDTNLDFNVNDCLLPGTPALLRFVTGECAGYDLEIASFNNSTKTFKVIVNQDDKGFSIPNELIYPAVDDRYVLLDIEMPTAYVTAAEEELQEAATDYLNTNSHPQVSYQVTFSEVWAKVNAPELNTGDLLTVTDTDLGVDTDLRIIHINRAIADSHIIKIDLSETVSKTTLTRIAAEIAKNTESISLAHENSKQMFAKNWLSLSNFNYLKEAMQGSTEIEGGLVGTNVIILKTLAGLITGGMSGLGDDSVGFWTGGTYEQAVSDAATAFKAAKATGALDRKDGAGHRAKGNFAWDAVGNVFFKGVLEALSGGKIGNFSIVNGKIVGYDGGVERIVLSTTAIPTSIANLSGSTVYADINLDLIYSGIVSSAFNNYVVLSISDTFNLPFATTLQTYDHQYLAELQAGSGVTLDAVAETYTFKKNGTTLGSCDAGSTIAIAETGTIEVIHYVAISFDFQDEQSSSAFTFDMTQVIPPSYSGSNAKTEVGNNGFYSYWSESQYIYFCPTVGFEVRFGSYIFQLTSSNGIRKSTNGGSSWSSL